MGDLVLSLHGDIFPALQGGFGCMFYGLSRYAAPDCHINTHVRDTRTSLVAVAWRLFWELESRHVVYRAYRCNLDGPLCPIESYIHAIRSTFRGTWPTTPRPIVNAIWPRDPAPFAHVFSLDQITDLLDDDAYMSALCDEYPEMQLHEFTAIAASDVTKRYKRCIDSYMLSNSMYMPHGRGANMRFVQRFHAIVSTFSRDAECFVCHRDYSKQPGLPLAIAFCIYCIIIPAAILQMSTYNTLLSIHPTKDSAITGLQTIDRFLQPAPTADEDDDCVCIESIDVH